MSKSVRKDPIFTGPFAKMCVAFVSYKRAQGIKYMGQIYLLRAFDDFCKDFKIESQKIPLEIAQAWSQPRVCFKTIKLTKAKCKREKQPHGSRRLFSHTA